MNLNLKITPQVEAVLEDQSLDEQDQSLDEQDQSLDEYVTAILLDTALDILAKSKSAEYVHPWWNAAPAKNRTHR